MVYNLFSVRLWLAIGIVFVVTQLSKTLLLGVGLAIGNVAEFSQEVVTVVHKVVNAIANGALKMAHGAEDFFTFHWNRLSHEGDYITRVHLTVPPVLSQLARLKDDIKNVKGSPVGQSLVQVIQLIGQVKTCPTLDYFRTISLSRWIINGLVDALLPELCTDETSEGVQVILFLFDGLPKLLGWIGTTGIVLWLVFIEGWPLIWWGVTVTFKMMVFFCNKIHFCIHYFEDTSKERDRWYKRHKF